MLEDYTLKKEHHNFVACHYEGGCCYRWHFGTKKSVTLTKIGFFSSGQIITTSHDLTPKGSWGWWNIIIWPGFMMLEECHDLTRDDVIWFFRRLSWFRVCHFGSLPATWKPSIFKQLFQLDDSKWLHEWNMVKIVVSPNIHLKLVVCLRWSFVSPVFYDVDTGLDMNLFKPCHCG